MAEDLNKKVDSNAKPRTNQPSNKQNGNNVTISADDLKQMKSNMIHMNNTVHNLSTKLEDAHKSSKSDNVHPDKSVTKSNNQQNRDDNKQSYADLLDKVNKLSDQMSSNNKHAKLTDYTKQKLASNHMKVSKATLNHLIGNNTDQIDDNIKWYMPIYKRASKVHIQNKPHHTKSKVNVGAELAKQNGSNDNALDYYMKK